MSKQWVKHGARRSNRNKRARRGRDDGEDLFSLLLSAPWQISVVAAVVVFVVMRWIVPAQFNSPFSAPLAHAVSGLAPFGALILLIIAAASYFTNKTSNSSLSPPVDHTLEAADPSLAPEIDWNRYSGKVESKKYEATAWSIELLRMLEWHRFESLAAEYFRILGKRVETIHHGADGGIDARIFARDSDVLEYAVQCKAWTGIVGVKPVRELFGVMAHESAGKGIFLTTSTFSDEARQFASEHSDKLFLIDGPRFIAMIEMLSDEKKAKLLAFATEGDYTTPTCASCGIKMVWRTSGNFWGCRNYPRCRSTLRVASC